MKDLLHDETQRALIAALENDALDDAFDPVIAAVPDPAFKPDGLVREGTLSADIRAQLSSGLTPAGFAADSPRQTKAEALKAAPGPGESQLDFFLRTGLDGFAKLVAPCGLGPAAPGLMQEQRRSPNSGQFS